MLMIETFNKIYSFKEFSPNHKRVQVQECKTLTIMILCYVQQTNALSLRPQPIMSPEDDTVLAPKLANQDIGAYNDMLSCPLTTMMCFLTKDRYGFPTYPDYLFIKTYH